MATITTVVNTIMGTVLSWLYLGVFLFIIVKFIQMLTSFGGDGEGGGWWPFGKDGDDGGRKRKPKGSTTTTHPDGTTTTTHPDGSTTTTHPDGTTTTTPKQTKDEKFEEAEKNPSFLRVRVVNADDDGVKQANVEIYPSKEHFILKKIWGKRSRLEFGTTGRDGWVPSKNEEPWELPSIVLKVKVQKVLNLQEVESLKAESVHREGGGIGGTWDSVASWTTRGGVFVVYEASNKTVTMKSDVHLRARYTIEDPKEFTVKLPYSSEHSSGFEPVFVDAWHNGKTLEFEGRIE